MLINNYICFPCYLQCFCLIICNYRSPNGYERGRKHPLVRHYECRCDFTLSNFFPSHIILKTNLINVHHSFTYFYNRMNTQSLYNFSWAWLVPRLSASTYFFTLALIPRATSLLLDLLLCSVLRSHLPCYSPYQAFLKPHILSVHWISSSLEYDQCPSNFLKPHIMSNTLLQSLVQYMLRMYLPLRQSNSGI